MCVNLRVMQQQLIFDRYAFAQKLKTSGFNEAQTEGLTSAFDGAVRDAVATRQDVHNARVEAKADTSALRAEMKEEFANVRAEMKEEFANVRAELARIEVKGDANHAEIKLYIYRGLLIGVLSIIGSMFGTAMLVARLFIK